MVKHDVLKGVADKTGISQEKVDMVLSAYVEFVFDALRTDNAEKIPLIGMGNFTARKVAERSGIARIGGDKTWTVPAHTEVKFTVGKSVRTL